ncbi:hypothetical protein LY90DRAFT_418999 [Neocallimastix californiae]|uniref:Uncharacterized protein n=1 Tax=Neocallimastix californiae TaxID=1754190 RepID=A0A1Y2C0A1_9FUNG|nr:hypothetical protein LY90DRAFT_418999 [Neocallimastix californiae]|eukprot:ORY40307.1 hypothetical protein LY90DRAFT_418999 [Neocallimastix californiae]
MRPFWLMRLLSRSMYEGGYLTPRLYVPRQLWYQRGVKYVAIDTKYQACINLVQHLQKIRNTKVENCSEVYEVLRGLENEMEAIQNMLSKKLKFIDEIIELGAVVSLDKKINMSLLWKYGYDRLSRSMDKFTNKKGEKVGDVSGYIDILITLFNQAQFFVEWINYIEAKGKANPNELQYAHIHNQLGRISYFFGRVICTFVLRDFEMLLDRYLYKLKQNIFF